jgi:hypothetical protein
VVGIARREGAPGSAGEHGVPGGQPFGGKRGRRDAHRPPLVVGQLERDDVAPLAARDVLVEAARLGDEPRVGRTRARREHAGRRGVVVAGRRVQLGVEVARVRERGAAHGVVDELEERVAERRGDRAPHGVDAPNERVVRAEPRPELRVGERVRAASVPMTAPTIAPTIARRRALGSGAAPLQ